jgi:hypothetical protein
MVKEFRSWFQENHGLVYFLLGQLAAFLGIAASLIAYSVKLEARVNTLETRGSPHLERVDGRLTTLESELKSSKERLERLVDKLTK